MAQRPIVEFWYDFASTYCIWRPCGSKRRRNRRACACYGDLSCSGPSSQRKGSTRRPTTSSPTRAATCGGTWSARRQACASPFYRPKSFPQNSLLAARVRWSVPRRAGPRLHAFGLHRGIRQRAGHRESHGHRRHSGGARARRSHCPRRGASGRTKLRLRRIGEEAKSRGVFGAPTLIAEDGELFWGNDRLERAFAGRLRTAPAGPTSPADPLRALRVRPAVELAQGHHGFLHEQGQRHHEDEQAEHEQHRDGRLELQVQKRAHEGDQNQEGRGDGAQRREAQGAMDEGRASAELGQVGFVSRPPFIRIVDVVEEAMRSTSPCIRVISIAMNATMPPRRKAGAVASAITWKSR